MTKENLFLLDVLKAFVKGEKVNFDVELDWIELMRLSSIHSVTGILGYMAIQNPCERTAPMLSQLKTQCLGTIALFAQRTEKAKQILAKLSEAGIDNMCFKGYIVRNYYPIPELRTFGDIDILIKPEDRKKAHLLMLEQGLEVKTDWEPVYSYCRGGELYEIHTELMEVDISDKADYKGYFKAAWDHAKHIEGNAYEPAPEFHFIYIITHVAKHIYGAGAGIRMYMDIAMFIEHCGDSVDWQAVELELEKLKLRDFANTVLAVTEKFLGVKSPLDLNEIADDVMSGLAKYIMAGGVFGQLGCDSGLATLKNSSTESRISVVLHRLFPSADSIEARYTYLQGNHWLLPVAWMHRFFKTRDTWKKHAAEAKRIMNADSDEVARMKQIYKEIGL